MPAQPVSGRFYRIIFASDRDAPLRGALSPEGRFHHDGQPALYMSPSPQAAAFAIARYLRPNDPPRLLQPLHLEAAQLLDLRNPAVIRHLGLNGNEASVPWQPERQQGLPATPWRASDAARAAGADGILYAARSEPSRWHIVLFRWNGTGPRLAPDGPATPFFPNQTPAF